MIVSEEILFARRRLEEINNLRIVEDLKWDKEIKVWYILVKIHVDKPIISSISEDTMWYIVLSDKYPRGDVKVYPAVIGGIEDTYYHQNNNGLVCRNGLWRAGKLCLNNPFEDITGIGKEPNSFEDKLYWNAERAVEWVTVAATNQLVKKGDYYETPDFKIKERHCIIYNEDIVSMMEWEDSEGDFGYVDFICGGNNQYYSNTYMTTSGKICKTTRWGRYISTCEEKICGAWIMLNAEPVIKGWQAPNNFKELKQAIKQQNMDLKDILEKLMPHFRDGKRHILMIGFPIPEKVGMDRCLVHWESLCLPVLSYGKKTAKGFRSNEQGWKMRDFQEIITNEKEIDWLLTENWNSKEILNRGRFEKNVTKRKILLIGAGTLGASIGEQLIRGGVYKLTIIDGDIYTIGNSARHILSMDSVGKNKAIELAKHYNTINPNIVINALDEEINQENISILEGYDTILDCSANNDVLRLLSSYETKNEKQYISISFGYKAEILYFAYQKGKKFNLDKYIMEFGAKIKENEEAIMGDELPWEGTGCWSPVFPAMAADVQLVASFATGIIKNILEKNLYDEKYYIYQKKKDQDGVIKDFARI